MQGKWKKALSLFLYFFTIGWYTFGGGWGIIAQLQKDYVEGKQEITGEKLLNIVSVGRSMPGTMIGNVAYLFGYEMAGVPGAILSVIGMITPSIIILTVLTFFYTNVKDNVYVAKALMGVRAVVAPVILSAVLKLHKGSFSKWICFVLCGVSIVLSFVFKVSALLIVVMGLVVGFFAFRGEGEQK